MLAFELDGHRVEAQPERALWWPSGRTLFIADLHLGKGSAFAAAGIPVPSGPTAADLADLGAMIDRVGAERVVILGDLLHARTARDQHTLDAFSRWRAQRRALSLLLIRGNHDAQAGDPPGDWRFDCADEPFEDGPFTLAHHPEPALAGRGYGLCGHVHPAARLRGPGWMAARAPCMVIGPRRAILPAFGRFTGGKVHAPAARERLIVFGPGGPVEVRVAAEDR